MQKNVCILHEDLPFDTETLGYYFTVAITMYISASFMMPFLFQVVQYHADDSLKVHNSNITTCLCLAFIKLHLQTAAQYAKITWPFCTSQCVHMLSKLLTYLLFCMHVWS